ncbi:hypothetical protein [Salinispora mooreana]|uniref:hypothetical protein n=2 Tax=Salinispora mooreana TaxID=999545 RepID=UPI001CC39655|nr:hypothetical protein [Salinispora mooreana]
MSGVLAAERVVASGHCPVCAARGRAVLAAPGRTRCVVHLGLSPVAVEATRAGQLRLALPDVARVPPLTGQRVPCVDCAAAGVAGLGVSRDGPGSAPLCLGCWRRRQRRAARRGLTPEESGWLAELAERLACQTCGGPDQAAVVDLPVEVVRRRRWRRRQRRRELREKRRQEKRQKRQRGDSGRRRQGCWRCGDEAWIASSARAAQAAEVEQAAAESRRVDELRVAHRAAVRRVARAERRLTGVQAWRDRVAGVLEAMPRLSKTGPRGQLQLKQSPTGRARAVWLIADFLARAAADRAERGVSGRGRPSQHPLVVGVMAVAADPAAGRRSMAGLHPTAARAGVAARTVTTAWANAERVGATVRTEAGRNCSLAEREDTGLRRRRTVHDFAALHTSPFDPTPHLGEATAVLARLLQRALVLVDEHQEAVAEAQTAAEAAQTELLDAQAAVAERAAEDLQLQASVSAVWAPDARQALTTAIAARGRANQPTTTPADRRPHQGARPTEDTVRAAFDLANRMTTFFHPPRMGLSKKSSSGYRGYHSFSASTSLAAARRRPPGRGERPNGGASRPAPTRRVTGPTSPTRPRTTNGRRGNPPAHPRRSTAWAKPLARSLAGLWDFLAQFLAAHGCTDQRGADRERGRRIAMIAATLAPRLSGDWTADDVVRLVEHHGLTGRYAETRTIIPAGDAHSPLSYLAAVLDRALTNPNAEIPHPSPMRERRDRDHRAADHAATLAHTTDRHAEWAAREQARQAERAGPGHGRHTALAAARAAGRGDHTTARTIAATTPEPRRNDEEWPHTAQPGSGLPAGGLDR